MHENSIHSARPLVNQGTFSITHEVITLLFTQVNVNIKISPNHLRSELQKVDTRRNCCVGFFARRATQIELGLKLRYDRMGTRKLQPAWVSVTSDRNKAA